MANPRIPSIDEPRFAREVLEADVPVLVEFGAAWCGPCRALAPLVARLADERPGRLRVAEVDVDESPALAARYGVRGVPTLVVFAGGREVARHVGLTSRERLAEMVDRASPPLRDDAASTG